MRFLSGVLFLALVTAQATAQTWYARGTFNGWSTANPMTDEGSGHYTATIPGLNGNTAYMFKIADENWTGATTHPASDSRVYSDGVTDDIGQIKFHLWDQTSWDDGWSPNNNRRVGYDDHQQFDWEIVGSFNGWPGETHDPNFYLTDMGNGLHRGSFTFDSGIYDFKFRGLVNVPPGTGIWDTSIGNDFGNGAGNNSFVVTSDGDEWTFELDLPNGRFRYFTDAAPPGQAGDYNENGIVDAADYTKWRDNLGSTTALPNDGGLGTPISSAHYDQWKANFGQGMVTTWLARNNPINGQTQIADQELISLGGGQYELNMMGLTAGDDYEFQVVRSDLSSLVPGSNMKVPADANGEIRLNFYELDEASWSDGWSPANTHRLGYDDPQQFDWELIGSFNGWPSGNDPLYNLTDQGNGLHTGAFMFATPGTFDFKFREQGDWQPSIGPDFGNSAGNNSFTVTNPNELWHFELDLPNGRWRAFLDGTGAGSLGAVPEPGSLAIVMIGLFLGAAAGRRR